MKKYILHFSLAVAALFSSSHLYAQPGNDNCASAQSITPNGTCVSGTTVGANDSWNSTVGCQTGAPNSHEDVWYSFVATGSNFTSTVTTSGAWTDNVEFVLVSGSCAGFTLVTSSCGVSPLTVTATGLTVGTTYYFTVSNTGAGVNGPFQVCTTTSSPPVNCTDNDDCATPAVISFTPNVQTCLTDCNTGAAPGPEFTGNNCYDFPEETVWYQVTTGASAATIDIALTSAALSNPYFAVFTTTNCTNYTIVNCTQGAAGSASNTVAVSANTTYLIAVSDQGGQTGNFNLCVTVEDDNSACNTNDQLTVTATSMGSPLTGPFQPGETVTFCYTITDWQPGASCNYLQGIVPTFGDCWDPVSFSASGQPVTITSPLTTAGTIGACPPGPPCPWSGCVGTSAGTWSWFSAGAVTYNNITGSLPPNSPLPGGWFFLTSYSPTTNACTGDPTDPDNSYGDNSFPACNSTLDWQVCFQLKARTSIACTNGQTDCSVSMKTYADGEIGVWNNLGCVADIPAVLSTTLSCCVPPTANAGSDISICSQASGTIGAPSVAGMTYSWSPSTGLSSATSSNPTVTLTNTTAVATTVQFVVTQTETASGCSDTDTIVVTVNPLPTVAIAGTTAICNPGSTTLTASGANTYMWSPSTGLSATTGSTVTASPTATTTYTITGTSAAGCIDTTLRPVRVTTILAGITSTTNVLCNGGTTGSATVAGSGGTGAYGYTWNTSPVQNTPSATSLAAGTYTATVSNSGCSDTTIAIITQPSALTASTTPVNPTCNGATNGSATANPMGGTGAYTYSWNTSPAQTTATATGLGAGTHTVTITDANGCIRTATATLTAPAAITVGTSTTNTNCGSGTGTATATPAGGTGSYTYSWATTPSQSTQTATGLIAGVYNVTITDANGCTGTGTATVNNNGAPTVTINSVTNILCNGSTTGSITANATGGAGGYTYTWNSTPVQNTATASGLGAGSYSVSVTDAAGCTGTASGTITQPTLLTLSASSTSPLCNGGNGTATVTPAGGTGTYTYSWNTTPVQTTATANSLPAGTYSVTVTDANGCVKSTSVTITQPTALTASTTSTPASCNGGVNGTATASASGGTGTLTYSWNTTPVQTSAVASGLIAGNYTVLVTDANGCTASASTTVSQPAAITATTTFVSPLCNGNNNGSATVTPAGGTGAFTYSWNTTPAQTTATATGLIAGTYNVLITDANGCTHTTNVTVTQPDVLNVSLTGVNPTCNAGTNGSVTSSVTGGTGTYTYSWNTAPVQTTSNATGLGSGSYTVNVTDANGCNATATTTLAQPTAISSTVSVTNVTCFGLTNGSATVNASGGTGALTYSWNSTPVQTSATATNLAAGSYVVTITDASGCTGTANATITQPGVLTSSISSSTNVSCNNGSNGSATVLVSGGTTAYTYSWNTVPVQTTSTATGLAAGNYSVSITDANGCTVSSPVTITQPAALTVTTATTNTNCGASTGTATATPAGGTGSYTYSWNTVPAQTTQTATALGAGAYNVTVTDANGCAQTSTATVNNNGSPTLSMSSVTNANCFGTATGSLTVSATGGTGAYTYSWNTVPTQNTATASSVPAGTYAVTVTDAAGCIASITGTITEPTELSLTVTGTNPVCNGSTGSATTSVTGGTGAYTYSWNTTPVQTTSGASNLSGGSYQVQVTDANGCTDMGTVTITEPLAILVDAIGSPALCFGSSNGSAAATVTNGVGSLDYIWSTTPSQITPIATGLNAGTYTITVIDANNCIGTDTAVVAEPVILVADITASTNVACNGAATGTATAGATGGTGSYTYSWDSSPVQTTSTATGLPAGTFNVSITDANGCMATDQVQITEPLAIAVDDSIRNSSCAGGDGMLILDATGGTGSYQYSLDNGVTFQSGGQFNNLSGGTYQAVVTDNNGCVFNATYTIGTSGGLVATLTSSTNANCASACDGTAAVSVSGGTGNYTYSWSSSPSDIQSSVNSLCAGSYVMIVTEEQVSGATCSDTLNITITEPASISTTTASTVATCGSSNGTASVSATGGTSPFSYSWNTVPPQLNDTATGLAAGSYMVTITDANNCTATATVNVTTPGGLQVDLKDTVDVTCNGLTNGFAVAEATGGTGPYTYEWTPGAVLNDTLLNVGAGSYLITVTDATGCTTTNTAVIGQPDPLTLATAFIQPLCNGSLNGEASVSATGGTPTYTYSWNNGVQNDTLTGIGQGSYDVFVTDANGCTTTASVQVTEPAAIAFTVTGTDPLCNNDLNGTAEVTGITGGTPSYSYSWSDGTTNASTTGLSAGPHSVTVTDANSCSTTENFSLNNPLVLSATVTSVDATCSGSTNGSAAVTNQSGGTGAYTYSWSTNPVQTGATATGLAAGNYTVVITDANNCSLTLNPTINEPLALVTVATGQPSSCSTTTDGQAAVVSTVGGTTPYTYIWSNSMTGTPITGLAVGTYTLTATDANGCTATDTAIVTSPTALTATGTSTLAGCDLANGSAMITALGGTGAYTYSWTDQPTATGSQITSVAAGNYAVQVTDANNCTVSISILVQEDQRPDASFTATPTEGLAPLTVVFNNTSTNADAYSWNFGNDSTSTNFNPSTLFTSEGSYVVLLTATSGACIDTMSTTIKVIGKSMFEIPNVFTPDNNGKNDEFSMISKNISSMHMQIFNRWGEKLFDAEDATVAWKGTQKDGKECSAGTYYYIITAKGVDGVSYGPITGFVTLIRE